jgi:hypothetical protein
MLLRFGGSSETDSTSRDHEDCPATVRGCLRRADLPRRREPFGLIAELLRRSDELTTEWVPESAGAYNPSHVIGSTTHTALRSWARRSLLSEAAISRIRNLS